MSDGRHALRARSAGVALAALLLLAPPARAGDETKRVGPGLEARVWCPWPETVQRGWAPVFVELRNVSSEERVVEIEAPCFDWDAQRTVRTAARIEPAASVELELLVPLGGVFNNQYSIVVRCEDDTTFFGDAVGAAATNARYKQVLLLADGTPGAGAVERWSAAVSTEALQSEGRVVFGTGYSGTTTISGTSTSSPTPNDVTVACAPFTGMPRHHGGYSSLDLVVLDPEHGMPSEERLAGLLAWVRTGGSLLVMGAKGRSAAEGVPDLAAWMEPRFEGGWPVIAGRNEYRCGLGRLFVTEVAGDLEHEFYVDWVRRILDEGGSAPPRRSESWRSNHGAPPIPGLERLPYRSFAALLLLFAIVIGPVNFLAVRKRKNPVLLLLTIPTIALFTTVALLAYGILFQGIDVKSASRSVAVLDQRTHRSASVEERRFFAGLAPAVGLAPGSGTVVHSTPDDDGRHGWSRGQFEVEFADGTLLSGDYLPSRKATVQMLAVERAERARLDVRRSGEGLRVDNNLGTTIERLLVRDPEGGCYTLTTPLAPGASAELPRPLGESDKYSELTHFVNEARLLTPAALHDDETLPAGCYLALLEASPFRDACGIETNELASEHLVLGVLPLEPEAWR